MRELKVYLTFLLLVCVFLFAGCGNSTNETGDRNGGDVAPEELAITLPEGAVATIQVGGTLQLGVQYTPANTTLTDVTWESSIPSVATVDDTGLVTAVAGGNTIITVQSTQVSTARATMNISITTAPVPVTGISFANTTMTLDQYGATKSLAATITPSNASNRNVVWESSDPTKVSLSGSNALSRTLTGLLPTEENEPVTITITTQDGDFSATCQVTVNPFIEVTGIALDAATLDVMASKTLTATLTPSDATNQTVTWESSDPDKVTVDLTGLTVRVIACGEVTSTPVTITATVTKREGTPVQATCQVSVIAFSGTVAFGWDAEDDPSFTDLPWQGTRTIGSITVYNYSTNSSSGGSVTPGADDDERAVNGVMKAVQKDQVVKPDPDGDAEFTVTKAGYWLNESSSPCLQIGSNAWNRTNTTNIFDLVDKDGNPAIEGQFDLSRACKITVEYTGIANAGSNPSQTFLVAILNNSGSVNATNSPLRENSGQFETVEADGVMKTYTRIFDPTTLSNYNDIKAYLEKAFIIVRAGVAGTQVVVHSVKVEVLED